VAVENKREVERVNVRISKCLGNVLAVEQKNGHVIASRAVATTDLMVEVILVQFRMENVRGMRALLVIVIMVSAHFDFLVHALTTSSTEFTWISVDGRRQCSYYHGLPNGWCRWVQTWKTNGEHVKITLFTGAV